MRLLAIGLVLVGFSSTAWGEETPRSPGRQTLFDIRRLGTALELWLQARIAALSPEEQTAMEAKSAALLRAEKQTMIERGEWVDPDTLTAEQMIRGLNRPRPRGRDFGETKRLSLEQVRTLLQPVGSKPYLETIPTTDGWGRPIEVWGDLDNLLHHTVFAIRSAGENGLFDGLPYGTGGFETGNEFDDIVWVDGFFYRWPKEAGRALEPGPAGTLYGLEAEDDL